MLNNENTIFILFAFLFVLLLLGLGWESDTWKLRSGKKGLFNEFKTELRQRNYSDNERKYLPNGAKPCKCKPGPWSNHRPWSLTVVPWTRHLDRVRTWILLSWHDNVNIILVGNSALRLACWQVRASIRARHTSSMMNWKFKLTFTLFFISMWRSFFSEGSCRLRGHVFYFKVSFKCVRLGANCFSREPVFN